MSREDLVAINQSIVADVTKKLVALSPNTILIVVTTNPLGHHVLTWPTRPRVFRSTALSVKPGFWIAPVCARS